MTGAFCVRRMRWQRCSATVPEAIANTVELSSRLNFELNDLGYEFPRYPVPEGETMDSFLRKRTAEGVMRRYGSEQTATCWSARRSRWSTNLR